MAARKASSFLSCSKTQDRSALRGEVELGDGGQVAQSTLVLGGLGTGQRGRPEQEAGGPSFLAVPWIQRMAESHCL